MFPIFAGNSASTGYNLTRSLRFRASASAYLNRTPASATNRRTFTLSTWVKRGALTSYQNFMRAGGTLLRFTNTDTITYDDGLGSSNPTTAVFRDPSAWYHVVLAVDTTQATSTNRVKIYVNSTLQTITGTYPTLNSDSSFNNNVAHFIGQNTAGAEYLDGYLAEFNFIDGQALTPSSFGSTNALTGVWQPARYAGSYGTNGFYLPFTDNSALTTSSNVGLGKDFSGNGNYWTTNNISITAGVTYDSMTDVPTLTSATAANFCVWNPLSNTAGSLTNGNLTFNGTASGAVRGNSTFAVSSGKWYFESTLTTAGAFTTVGIGQGFITNQYPGFDALSYVLTLESGDRVNNNTSVAYGSSLVAGDVFICAFDLTNNKIWFGKNGTWFASGDPATGANPAYTITAGTYCPIARPNGSGAVLNSNFGQRPFSYTPPTGFVALNTYNLPTSTIVKGNTVMDATLYTGTLLSNAVTNAASFKPDLVWIKSRSAATSHKLTDSVRGVTKGLVSNTTAAETTDTQGLTAFNTNGFTVGTNTDDNNLAATYVAWQWQAGQGSTSSNTNGTITSTVSVNASAGFSVVTYTGTGANATIGHGLGVAPQLVITKCRGAGTTSWAVWHINLTSATYYLLLDSTAAQAASSTVWNSTAPTSSVFSVGTSTASNFSTMVAYCWTPIAGFSAFGSYTGNASTDGPFVYTGFRPKFVMIKCFGAAASWCILDSSRDVYNPETNALFAESSVAEGSGYLVDFLSNGFKVRNTGSGTNSAGTGYIFAAFAENPLKYALAR
jgi:hypothetical protein